MGRRGPPLEAGRTGRVAGSQVRAGPLADDLDVAEADDAVAADVGENVVRRRRRRVDADHVGGGDGAVAAKVALEHLDALREAAPLVQRIAPGVLDGVRAAALELGGEAADG